MPQKSEETVHILEGKAILYKREGTPHWQVRYKVYQIRIQSQRGDKVIVRMSGFGGQYVYFNNFNSKIVATAANGANRKNLDPFVEGWMGD